MKKLFLAFALTALSSVFAFAQATDYSRGEVFVGYSNQQVDLGTDSGNTVQSFFRDRQTHHGFEVAGVYNVNRYVGVKGSVSGAYRSRQLNVSAPLTPVTRTDVSFDANTSLHNVLGGVQFKDNAAETRVRPFAHVLAGVGHGRIKVENVRCPVGIQCPAFIANDSQTGFAGAFGGGIDVRLNRRVDVRVIQVDYNPIRFNDGLQHNVRFGVGLVFK